MYAIRSYYASRPDSGIIACVGIRSPVPSGARGAPGAVGAPDVELEPLVEGAAPAFEAPAVAGAEPAFAAAPIPAAVPAGCVVECFTSVAGGGALASAASETSASVRHSTSMGGQGEYAARRAA